MTTTTASTSGSLLDCLLPQADLHPHACQRQTLRAGTTSGVTRITCGPRSWVAKWVHHLGGDEAAGLAHAAQAGLAVPEVHATARTPTRSAVLMHDLGPADRTATATDVLSAAVRARSS